MSLRELFLELCDKYGIDYEVDKTQKGLVFVDEDVELELSKEVVDSMFDFSELKIKQEIHIEKQHSVTFSSIATNDFIFISDDISSLGYAA